MLRACLVFSAVFVFAFCGTVRAEESPFNVDFFCGWGGCFRPMEWTPVEIGIGSTLDDPFDGMVVLSAPQDGLNTLDVRHKFVLTPDLYQHLPLVTKFAFSADRCEVRLVQVVRGRPRRVVWEEKYDLWGRTSDARTLKAVEEKDMLVGTIGSRGFGLLRLPKQAVCRSQGGQGNVYLGDKLPRMVPWDWTGFVSLDVLILYNPIWSQFNRRQLEAISEWVSNGGRLLLVLGTNALAANNPIAEMLPVDIQQAREIETNSSVLAALGLESSDSETLACRALAKKQGVILCDEEVLNDNDCLFATGYVGFGRVGVLGFDPSDLSDIHKTRSSQFWVGRIKAVLEDSRNPTEQASDSVSGKSRNRYQGRVVESFRTIQFVEDAEKGGRDQGNYRQFEIGLAQAANNAVMNYLYKGIRPLSIWWVILLLTILAVLLGPLDYIFLKRKDKLPLTWVTCTFWIVAFTVGAYYGVQFLRSGDMELRVVSVTDGIDNGGVAWSTDYCGLFAPKSDEYRFKDLTDEQWWSGIAPTQQQIWSYRPETGSRKIYCTQEDGKNWPTSLPINIWTIQCLLNEGAVERTPLSAEVRRDGDRIVVSVSNESDTPIVSGYVLLDDMRGMRFDRVAPRSTEEFSGPLGRVDGWRNYDRNRLRNSYYGHGNYDTFKREDALFAQGSLQRTQAIHAYLAHGAAVVYAEFAQSDKAPVSFKVDSSSCKYDHIQLARLVVFPK